MYGIVYSGNSITRFRYFAEKILDECELIKESFINIHIINLLDGFCELT